jgi:hypothetical protein
MAFLVMLLTEEGKLACKDCFAFKGKDAPAPEYDWHQGRDFWNQNDSFLNLNDCASKRPFFNMRSKIPHKFGNLVLLCESQSNQRRPCLT